MTTETEISSIVADEKSQSIFVDQLLQRQDAVIEQLDALDQQISDILSLYNANCEAELPENAQPDSDHPIAA